VRDKIGVMITDADITKLNKTFATKEDLKKFATKKEHDQHTKQIDRIIAILATKADSSEMNRRFDEIDTKFDKMLNRMDRFYKRIEDLHLEYAAVSVQTTRLNEWAGKVAEKVDVPFDY
jgi:chromosome segregation ATPase